MDITADPNNNTPREKSYSLRPRSTLKKGEEDTDPEESWRPRGRSKRRSKQKCLPLSKYRRKTANARERSRMREINEAFEALRRALPHFNTRVENNGEKTTKIMTLRLAMKYISALDSALRKVDFDSDGESLISDYCVTPPASREHSLTPSSLSEQSDIFDQLFITSSFEDYPPSASSSSCAVSPFLNESLKPHSLSSTTASAKLDTCQSFFKSTLSPLSDPTPKMVHLSTSVTTLPTAISSRSSASQHSLPATYPLLTASIASQPETYSFPLNQVKDSIPSEDIQDYAPSSWREFDCLPSSPMSLDDLFIVS